MGNQTDPSPQKSDFHCMKHGCTIAAAPPVCRDPTTYCKFRPSCMIWFLKREEEPSPPASSGGPS